MTALAVIELVAIVILMVLVAGLLRSHADILRALHGLGIDLNDRADDGSQPGHPGAGLGRTVGVRSPGRRPPGPTPGLPGAGAIAASDGRVAADLAGRSPSGDALRIPVTSVRHDTLLAFLTTGCTTCLAFWQAVGQRRLAVPGDARVVVVVHDAGEESISRVESLSPAGIRVVMSSAAWDDYGVAYAPYFVYVSGPEGRVVGEGVAGTWQELASLMDQALADAGAGPAAASVGAGGSRAERGGGRIDSDLRAAGIVPGDPRLYPARLDQAPLSGQAASSGQAPSPDVHTPPPDVQTPSPDVRAPSPRSNAPSNGSPDR
ncbi:MAG: hypothetical protein ACRDZ8_15485 [Acidimicrobiales bacterium]